MVDMTKEEDGIVAHKDILSSPKKRSNSPSKIVAVEDSTTRRRPHSKKNSLEKVKLPESNANSIKDENVQEIPDMPQQPRRKRGRPRKSESEKHIDTSKPNKMQKMGDHEINGSISAENILPRTTRKRGNNKPAAATRTSDDDDDDNSRSLDEEEDFTPESSFDESDKLEDIELSPELDRKSSKSKRHTLQNDVLAPSTPSKTKRKKVERDFTSPLKREILNNLKEYKDNSSNFNLKLSKNFVPTPLPKNYDKEYMKKLNMEKSTNMNFFDTFEGYFDQKKTVKGIFKSKNTMAMAPEVTREEFTIVSNYFNKYYLKREREKLFEIQKKMYTQYWFELSQGFSLLFYGIGSKREFLENFAIHYLSPKLKQVELHSQKKKENVNHSIPCIIVNGYNPTCNYRDVYKDVSNILYPEELTRNETKYWGNHVILQIQKMIQFYKTQPQHIKLIIVVHNLDGPSVRKEAFQTMLSSLALIKQIAIIASTDHIYAPILWDNVIAQNYNFIFHNVTNYEPSKVESSFQDVMKLGRKESTSNAEGARFVLQSLTNNSKKLYKLLLETQLHNMETDGKNPKGVVAPTKRGALTFGVELKRFHHLCTADFIVSNEMSLRTMLKEFIDHKMAFISKNQAGAEFVFVTYNYSEMKKLLDTVATEIK
ncbi:hypothetical protein KAFR_0C00440 [Kazachstania africana CBS 2517]|uniref:Origin recognition complex subunit 2 n=1 Tax=Kazachstania africana (strain ATCC 22294 / BCRC 22015 / CBS 2517 / CECT 1963 / NBRC 1671 / NRRL Y-8276) TaxID=1071382 RepID=H2ARN9_KAZAF|nr:hypothetical protein KAFR_0C00440 [Kazachstania africana CBS 2517]CCF57039.1 hypothetical protein KAFR_0C00440 [Kazachstania africana CBS 2517]